MEQKSVHSLAKQLKCHRVFTDAVIIVLGILTTISNSKLKKLHKISSVQTSLKNLGGTTN